MTHSMPSVFAFKLKTVVANISRINIILKNNDSCQLFSVAYLLNKKKTRVTVLEDPNLGNVSKMSNV